jgi:hypothetical protein
MSKITVDVPDNVLGEEKAKEIKSLRSKVKRLENENKKLKSNLAEKEELVAGAMSLKRAAMDAFQLYEGDDWKSWDM